MSNRHKRIMVAWAAVLIVVVIVFWNRLLPGRTDQSGAGGGNTAHAGAKPIPEQAGLGSVASPSARLHQALKARNPGYNGGGQFVEQGGKLIADLSLAGITDLSPLKGLPLEALDVKGNQLADLSPLKGMALRKLGLEGTMASDLSPLAGMPLAELYLNGTPVRDLSPLKGMPLAVLNLYGTSVEDISPLAGMPLKSLWLSGTRVKDISPLHGCPLVSLTLEGTPVADLSPLAGGKLERLHVGESAVTDLTPIKGLPLTRLIYTPGRVKQGIQVAREMTSIKEIGVTLDGRMPPERFWQLQDQGKLEQAP